MNALYWPVIWRLFLEGVFDPFGLHQAPPGNSQKQDADDE